MPASTYDPHRFRTAAAHYLSGRPAYSPRLIARVAALTGLTQAHDVLDLGCGPGQLATGFAPLAHRVVGVDPEPEMLRIARSHAPDSVTWIEGSSYDLGPQWGRFRLVTMGRSFHWMDRQETLRRLDTIIEPGGAVVLFNDSHPDLEENRWWPDYRAQLRSFTPEGEQQEKPRSRSKGHESVLFNSPFNQLELIAVIEQRRTSIEALVSRALSMSSTSAAFIGERTEELSAAIRCLLAPFAPSGMLSEVIATQALIATRE